MNIIFYHLDELLDFHRRFEKYWHPSIPDENGNPVYPTEEGEYQMNVYRSELKKIALKYSKDEKHWAKYITDLYGKLMKDGYVVKNKDRYSITSDGKIFKGYVRKQRRKILKNIFAILGSLWLLYEIIDKVLDMPK